MSDESDVLEAQNGQREHARRATLDLMRAKRARRDEFTLLIDGEPAAYTFVSIGSKEYDRLLGDCPPTTEQMARGESYNQDKFAPELLARVSQDPKMTVEEWTEIFTSPDWNRGELGELFGRAVNVCSRGLDPGPTVGD